MGDHNTERYRRGQTWRAFENVRDDDAYDPWRDDAWSDNRGLRARDQDWQPESASDEWDDARRRQRLTPGQTSDGGPPRSGYAGAYRDSGQWQGSNLRYGLNGGYASSDSPESDAQRRQQEYRSRRQASEFGDYGDFEDYGGPQGNRGNRGYQGNQEARGYGGERGWEQGRGQRGYQQGQQGQRGQQGFGSADQQWLRRAQQREPWQAGGSGHDAYFNDLRSDTRYWTEPRDEWGESRPSGGSDRYAGRQPYAQSYGRDYPGTSAGTSGYDEELGYRSPRRWSDDDDDRDQGEEHGALYNLGHRIGEAVSNFFGHDDDDIDKRNVPRGYTRTDERIRDQICERLTFTSGVDVGEVSVDVDKGKVTLSGTVHQRSQKYAIEDIADNTFGVTEVENNIRVEKREAPAGGTSAGSNGW